MDRWNTILFVFGMAYFQGRTVSFREGNKGMMVTGWIGMSPKFTGSMISLECPAEDVAHDGNANLYTVSYILYLFWEQNLILAPWHMVYLPSFRLFRWQM